MTSRPVAIVSGASAGIGRETSLKLAEVGFDLILGARRLVRLEELKEEIQKSFPSVNVFCLELDVCNLESCQLFFEKSRPLMLNRRVVLVNNAGLALGTDTLAKGDLNDWNRVLDTNVMGVLRILRLFLPDLIQNSNKADLVFLSSVAAHESYPGGGVYCASKHALRSIVKTLRLELCGYTHLRVLSIDPGMVDTDFSSVRFKGDENKARSVYDGIEPLCAADIASVIVFAVSQPSHVNIDEIKIMPTAQAATFKVHRGTPLK